MPLFFMISGYLFSYKKYSTYTQLIYAKARSLLLPYLSFSVLSILILSVADFFGVNYLPSFGLNPMYFQELILAKRNYITYNSPLWFFPTLFLVEVMYYFLKRILRNDIILYVVIIIIGFWGYRNSQSQHWFWTFDMAPYYVVFLLLVSILKDLT